MKRISMKFKHNLFGLLLPIVLAVFAVDAKADLLLIVDLTTTNQVSITATGGLSAVTTSGSDTTGVYFQDFYSGSGNDLSDILVAGDLTNAENPTDNTAELFRGGFGTDTGLNLWSFSSDSTVSFTAGSLAFTGSGTWTLDAPSYADMLSGNISGNLYFPADTVDDLSGAQLLGTYSVVKTDAVPEPATFSLIAAGLLGLAALRRRRSPGSRPRS